jgi:hypothetical protein
MLNNNYTISKIPNANRFFLYDKFPLLLQSKTISTLKAIEMVGGVKTPPYKTKNPSFLKISIFYFPSNKHSQNHNSHTNNYPKRSAH